VVVPHDSHLRRCDFSIARHDTPYGDAMIHPLSMFMEKEAGMAKAFSMTRLVAFMFAFTYCAVLFKNEENAHLIGWPFCSLGVVIVLAVPLQCLFKYLQVWFTSSPGQKLLRELLAKISPALALPANTTATVETKATTITSVATAPPIKESSSGEGP
jgi:hypothetical protein